MFVLRLCGGVLVVLLLYSGYSLFACLLCWLLFLVGLVVDLVVNWFFSFCDECCDCWFDLFGFEFLVFLADLICVTLFGVCLAWSV